MRARNIKPSFFTNPDLGECSPVSRLCFAGLWCCADREGRLPDRPKLIRAQVFPYDNIDVEPLLDELARFGFIERYEAKGVRVISIPNFSKHQRPHVKEKSSELPEKTAKPALGANEHLPRHEQAPAQVSTNTDLGMNEPALNPECGMRNPECGMRKEEVPEPAPEPPPLSDSIVPEFYKSSPEFRAQWDRWVRHRIEKQKPLGEIEEETQLLELARMFDVNEAIAVVVFSIQRGAINLLTNGDHKAREPTSPGSGRRGGKVSLDEGLLT